MDNQFRIAVIGSGPAGLYAAEELVRATDADIHVDLIDRLPTPYGLVRYGVAPDHPRIKSVTKSLQKILEHPRIRFLGNVEYGRDLTRTDLDADYHGVIFATGASLDRRLNIPGEDLQGSTSATKFVAWYSGHPDSTGDFSLDATSAVVVGAGNVALDVARILVKAGDALRSTDIPGAVLDHLGVSRVEHVHILCRRGPQFAKFTTKELRELRALDDVDVIVDPSALDGIDETDLDKPTLTNLRVFREFADNRRTGARRTIEFHFSSKPVEILGDAGNTVRAVTVERTDTPATAGTAQTQELSAQLVLRSVGYRGRALPDLPFEAERGIIPNIDGRIINADGGDVSGYYVSGWCKRGPSGVIGTNRIDSAQTVEAVLDDIRSGKLSGDVDLTGDPAWLARHGHTVIDYGGWLYIDAEELDRGSAQGRERTKISDWETLRRIGLARAVTSV
ncbi:FAD-dependent oxidoreductase [Gordonia sp. i37]|uniref:FAD-dependent oxidoreductase n=1 Tax=Gordonia sp. i37 TaxID=1961707 RepID=UPI0009D3364B|nr:FAD-dependent oxidoreductase [Gordonia sp. i37]OPX05668.1 hypothetical protein B1964_29270 [Gordonia sp. i37]